MNRLRADAEKIIWSAIDGVKPDLLIRRKIRRTDNILEVEAYKANLTRFENIYVIGAGKASGLMARELENLLGDKITEGVVSVKYGHAVECRRIRILEAGHPVIDRNALLNTRQILDLAEKAGERDLIICLISGGGSALLEQLPDRISLPDLQKVFELLLGCGAAIEEINAVRKHLSLVKGGRLAQAMFPAAGLNLILSDVIGDPLESIASGPTAPDTSTFRDAWEVVSTYKLENPLPRSVTEYLQRGAKGEIPDTLKPGDAAFNRLHNIIIGNNMEALAAAKKTAGKAGYHSIILTSRMQGEAKEVGKVVAAIVQEVMHTDIPVPRPACLLMGGETTVTMRNGGQGGRNQELALAALLAMKNMRQEYLIASCGTDGTDGPTDAAGGIIYPAMWEHIRSGRLNLQHHLDCHDAYPFLKRTGGLIRTGPTGTNVMDIILALIPS